MTFQKFTSLETTLELPHTERQFCDKLMVFISSYVDWKLKKNDFQFFVDICLKFCWFEEILCRALLFPKIPFPFS